MERLLIFVDRGGATRLLECEHSAVTDEVFVGDGYQLEEVGIVSGFTMAGLYVWEGEIAREDQNGVEVWVARETSLRFATPEDLETYFEYKGRRDGLVMVGPRLTR